MVSPSPFSEIPPQTPDFEQLAQGSRQKRMAIVLVGLIAFIVLLHLLEQGFWIALAIGFCLLGYILKLVFSPIPKLNLDSSNNLSGRWPKVSILVPAKNEEHVIGRLVENLCTLDYPSYEVWVIDDRGTDRTLEILQKYQEQYPQLHVHVRELGSKPGKSAALNEILPQTQGELLAVFDADAQIDPSFLRQTVPVFEQSTVGALQVRKAISNAAQNFWTQGQAVEMMLDAYFQTARLGLGGAAELRGNGQIVRRTALEAIGNWNEETITDDLDQTLRLHMAGWDIAFLGSPAVYEEGVTSWKGLWKQRSRWAEGGAQRYLDYYRPLLSNVMGWSKTWDQLSYFVIVQYLLPLAAIPDLLLGIAFGHGPRLTALVIPGLLIPMLGMNLGQVRYDKIPLAKTLLRSLMGGLYFIHWLPVMVVTLLKMALKPKKLVWVKTVHKGTSIGTS
jgi:1,2-diacylglycerol 3-beta-glucosyltransferase